MGVEKEDTEMCRWQLPRFHSFGRLNIWWLLLFIFCISAFRGITCSVLCWPCDFLSQWDVIKHTSKGLRSLVYGWFAVLVPLPLPCEYVPMVFCRTNTWRIKWIHVCSCRWAHLSHQCPIKPLQTCYQSPTLRFGELHFTTLQLTDTCVSPAEISYALLRFCGYLGGGIYSGNGEIVDRWCPSICPGVFWMRAMHVSLQHLNLKRMYSMEGT